MARWLSLFSEYNFVVHYKSGKSNILADALSRCPDYDPRMQWGRHAVGDDEDDEECAVCLAEGVAAVEIAATSPLRDAIATAYEHDAACSEMIKYLRAPSDSARRRLSPRSRSCVDRYAMDRELLTYCVDRVDTPRIVVPLNDDLRARIIHEFHDSPSAGHLGRETTFATLSRDFYWPHMYKWVRKWVRSCEACQRVKPAPSRQAPLRPLPVARGAWDSVSMDFVFGLPRDVQGHTGILVFVDRFSKMVHLTPVAASIATTQTAAIFVDTVYQHHVLPTSIVSDRDHRFTAAFWSELFMSLGTRLLMSTAYATSFKSWSSFLPMVEFALNNAEHASTRITPFYVNYGRHPRVPALLGVERSVSSNGTGSFDEDGNPDAGLPASRDLASSMHTSGDDDGHDAVGRESAHDTCSALLNGVTTRTAAKTAAQGVRTRATTRAAASLTSGSPASSVAARATPANTTSSAHQGRA
ncbi:hypothetical protein PC123_g24915 [Phytophthora cactorum]|nr:hypothetical protein PC120_g24355 [Phytophthora cactorum]KAG4039536.1 hypothetical protein PC123_g24915 [Phytophthora cactorum]